MRVWTLPVVLVSLLAAACGGGSGTDNAPPTAEARGDNAANPTEESMPTQPSDGDDTDLSIKPAVTVPGGDPPAELAASDLVAGGGAVAQPGDFLVMQYVGVSYSTGAQFDASWDRGQPFTFVLGAGRVIKGWDDGIAGMAVGGRRQLVIPPDQAYGEAGSASGSIGPNETLIFVVDLVGIASGSATKPGVAIPAEPATELAVNDLVEGEGPEAAEGDSVWVHYVGFAQSSGEQFDASWDRGIDQPIAFTLGIGQVIAGWDQGLEGMRVGGRREIIIPPELGYGETGAGGGVIAPNETLIFVVDLIAVN